jgi:hypothetical protein
MQDFVPPERMHLTFEGGWTRDVNVVHGLFVVGGIFSGDHIRASAASVVNVSGGGAMIPALSGNRKSTR